MTRRNNITGSHADIAHAWANETHETGKGSRMFFENGVIYSYGKHFAIAAHVQNKQGERAVLFTREGYSVSTAKHKSITRRACSHLRMIYCQEPELNQYNPKRTHEQNLTAWEQGADGAYKSLIRASRPAQFITALRTQLEQAQIYADFFGLRLSENMRELARIAYCERWTRALELAEERQAERARTWDERARARREAREARERLARRARLGDWRAGKGSLYLGTIDGASLLRYNTEERRIETSQGVKVPYTAARRMYTWLLSVRETGCEPCEFDIVGFKVRSVSRELVQVGCHNIPFGEIDAIAELLGWKPCADETCGECTDYCKRCNASPCACLSDVPAE